MKQASNWTTMLFKDACAFTSKPKGFRLPECGDVPFVPMELIPERTLYTNDFRFRNTRLLSSGTYIENGDVLLAKITPCFENGKQTIVSGLPQGFGFATTEVIPFKGRPGISDKEFLFFYLLGTEIRADLAAKMEGTTGRQRLNKTSLENLQILLPPVPEQRAIAHVLHTVQKAKEARQRELALERERKAALMEHLFTHGTRGEASKQTPIGEIPESWNLVALGTIYETQLGKMLSQKARGGTNPKPYLRNANVQWGRVDLSDLYEMDFSESEQKKFALRQGDLLICEGGEIGRTAIWNAEFAECYFQKAIHRARPRSADVEPEFLRYWMEWGFRIADVYGVTGTQTTIAHLPQEKLEQMKIPNPTQSDQRQIASVLSSCDAVITAAEKEISLLDELFSALLEEVMSGRLDVNRLIDGGTVG